MKKLTSLFCALAVIVSTSAAPQLRVPKAKSDKQQLEQRLSRCKTEKERAAFTYRYKHATLTTRHSPLTSNGQRLMPTAKREAQKVTIERYHYFISGGTSINYGLHNDELNMHFFYQFPLAEGKHNIEFGKTYTLAEMEAEGCEWDEEDDEGNLTMHYYTAATFCITKGEGFDVHIAATATDDLGNEYVFAYDETPVTPTGTTVSVNIDRPLIGCEYNETDHSWLLRAQDNNYFVQLQYYSANGETPDCNVDAADIELASTYVSFQTDDVDDWGDPVFKNVFAKDADIMVLSSNGGQRIDVNFRIFGEDGNQYAGTLYYALPEAETKEDFVATNLQVDTWAFELWGEIQIFASTDDGKSLSLDLYGDQAAGIPGTYTLGEGHNNGGSISVDREQYNVYSGTVTIAESEGTYSVTGSILCWNNVEYTLNLQEPEVTVTPLTFEGDDLILDLFEGAFQIAGFDSEHANFLSMAVYSNTVAGTYGLSDLAPEYTFLALGEAIYLLSTDANITVTYADEIASVTGTLRLVNQDDRFDVIELTINISAHPYVPSVRDVKVKDFAFQYYGDGPDVYYSLLAESEQQVFNFDIMVERWSPDVEFGRTYTLEEMIASTDTRGIDAYENTYVNYQSVSFTKTATDTGIKIVVTILDTRGNTWNLTYEGNDKETSPVIVTLGQANPITHADGGLEYEMVDVDNTFSCHLVIATEEGAEDVEFDSLYTSQDGGIDLEISYLSILGEEHQVTFAEFKKEYYDWSDAYFYSATVIDERGYQFNLSYYDDGFVLTGDTIEISINAPLTATYWEEYYEWMFYAQDEKATVNISVNSTSAELQLGEYDVENIALWSSSISFADGVGEDGVPMEKMVGFRDVEYLIISGTDENLALEAAVTGEDGNIYLIAVNKSTQAIDNTNANANAKAVKVLRDGQLLIEKNNRVYTILGSPVE